MKTLSKSLMTALAVAILGSGAAFAEHTVQRIDHPNGQPTFAPARHPRTTATIGVYAGGRAVGDREVVTKAEVGNTDINGRTLVPIHRGRGEVLYVPVQP